MTTRLEFDSRLRYADNSPGTNLPTKPFGWPRRETGRAYRSFAMMRLNARRTSLRVERDGALLSSTVHCCLNFL
jgi:hypothetical protein